MEPSGDPGTGTALSWGEKEELLTKQKAENTKRETFPVSPSTVSKSTLPCSEPSEYFVKSKISRF